VKVNAIFVTDFWSLSIMQLLIMIIVAAWVFTLVVNVSEVCCAEIVILLLGCFMTLQHLL